MRQTLGNLRAVAFDAIWALKPAKYRHPNPYKISRSLLALDPGSRLIPTCSLSDTIDQFQHYNKIVVASSATPLLTTIFRSLPTVLFLPS